jgi:hypothetical protein
MFKDLSPVRKCRLHPAVVSVVDERFRIARCVLEAGAEGCCSALEVRRSSAAQRPGEVVVVTPSYDDRYVVDASDTGN